MSNTPANNRPDLARTHRLEVDVHAHLDEEAERTGAGSGLPAEAPACLRQAATAAALERGFTSGRIEIAVVGDDRIRQVNRQHLGHDWETDVISFPYRCEGSVIEGELIVSWDTACREAADTGWPRLTELALYVIHGTLHLTGMDDCDSRGRHEMRAAEMAVLASLRLEGAQQYDVDRRAATEDSPSGAPTATERQS